MDCTPIDVLIFEKAGLARPQKVYFAEIGIANAGVLTPTVLNSKAISEDLFDADIYQIEFNGDGTPDLMFVNKKTGKYSIFKIDFASNALLPITGQQDIQLSNFSDKTPLIFGDFNGDGLTDFITPQTVYSIEGSTAANQLQRMQTEQLLWWQYIATGTGFIKTAKDYTAQKLSYMAPSQRVVIKRSSDWEKFWSGKPDSYEFHEYASCSVIPMDFNNDGKTDLVSFRKFGQAKYSENQLLRDTAIQNKNDFTIYSPWTRIAGYCFKNMNVAPYIQTITSYVFPDQLYWPSNTYICPDAFSHFVPCTPDLSYSFSSNQAYISCNVIIPTAITPTSANKIFFHLNTSDSNGNSTFTNLSTIIPLENWLISPLSLVLSATDNNQLNTYKSELYIHDPLVTVDSRFVINNDNFTEGQLRTIDNGSPIVQKIEYRPMVEKNNTDTERLYTTKDLALNYPFYIHKNIGVNYLVYKVHTLFDSTILSKEYRYENGIQHLQGKGFLGFQKTFCSDAYESVLTNGKYQMKSQFKAVFWKINTYNPLLENALSETTYGSLNPNSVFTRTITNSQKFNKGTIRYLIMPVSEYTTDYQKGNIRINKTFQYDTANDLLLQQINTDYNGIGASVNKYFYTPAFNNGDHIFFGKIAKTENLAVKDGLSFATKEEHSYFPDGTIKETKKYGNGTPAIKRLTPITRMAKLKPKYYQLSA